MENPWGKIILGGLAAAAIWNSLGPEGKRKAINVLEATLVTVEQVGDSSAYAWEEALGHFQRGLAAKEGQP